MCLSGRTLSISAQELSYAQRSVLALPESDGSGFRVLETIKGEAVPGSWINGKLFRGEASAMQSKEPLLLIRDTSWIWWVNFGPVSTNRVSWLRQLAVTKRTTEMNEAEWLEHLRFLVPSLENPERMVAEIAYTEIASAPYSVMIRLKPDLDVTLIRKWLADPQLESRQSAYTLLLGIAGGPADAEQFEQRIDRQWRTNGVANLAPMLAANLELRGPSRVAWIEEKHLRDRKRTTAELEAAVLALSEQGKADATIPRARIVEAYRVFIREHKPVAGLVAKDLADWNRWEFANEFEALLQSGKELTTASRDGILDYMNRLPKTKTATAASARR